ncbi:uncharacterized protein UTRI_05341_B [Ustilago trichophora]|uniref:Uncharacterized protein n=1 Tax=Ustilago trichophora TaxID=86804 RepID=A0A5C3ENE0_9BASI|nr:uncharacterized protein UTRI_05341_B [Ustilago trichophora]
MNEAMLSLHGLTTVIDTDNPILTSFLVISEYVLHEASRTDEAESSKAASLPNKRRRTQLDQEAHVWIVTVGSEEGWWSVTVTDSDLQELVLRTANLTDSKRSSEDSSTTFATKIRTAFERNSVMFGIPKSSPPDASLWAAIKLFIDLTADPVDLKLFRLTDKAALRKSTTHLLLRNNPASQPLKVETQSMSSFDLHQLQKKLEATQQALREERHKYRSLLAAPSSGTSRAGRRPVVGLGPSFMNGSQRAREMYPPSSSQSSGSRSGLPSSSSGAGGPSSDNAFSMATEGMRESQRASQRNTTSLVNPTRVRRADPGENAGFVGDDDE